MTSYFVILSLVILAAVPAVRTSALARDPYCCLPAQYVSSLGQINGLVLPGGKGIVQKNYGQIAVDFTNNQVGEEIVSISEGAMTTLKIIINYKENYMYIIIGSNCTKSPASGSFDQCIPKSAHYDGSFYFGDHKLTGDSFSAYANIPGVIKGSITSTVSVGDCIPLSTVVVGTTLSTPPEDLPILSNAGYVNFTMGIQDPGRWFNIPDICQKPSAKISKLADSSDPNIKLVSMFNSLLFPSLWKN